ncbi:MAG: hypothetical protein RIB80_01890 [Rhodospirillales bacterium]
MSDSGNNGATEQTTVALEGAMTEIETMILNARRALARGELLDMTPLGEHVANLCENVRSMALTSSNPDAIRERLEKMVLDLNQLEEQIRARADIEPDDNAENKD